MCLFSACASQLETVTLIQPHQVLLLPVKYLFGTFARVSVELDQRKENKNGCQGEEPRRSQKPLVVPVRTWKPQKSKVQCNFLSTSMHFAKLFYSLVNSLKLKVRPMVFEQI